MQQLTGQEFTRSILSQVEQGQLQPALATVTQRLDSEPDEPNMLRLKARILRELKRHDDARQVLEQTLQLHPDFFGAAEDLADMYFRDGSYAAAIPLLEKVLKHSPLNPHCWQILAEAHQALDNGDKADFCFSQQMVFSTNDKTLSEATRLFQQGRVPRAETITRQYLKQHPTDVNAIRLLAEIGLKVGALGDAENLLARCLELAPDFYLARLNYISVLSKRNRLDAALEQVTRVEHDQPNQPSTLLLKASVLAKLGRYEETIGIYEHLLSTFEPQAKIAMSYGHALKTVGDQNKAIAAYRQSIDLDSKLGEAYWSLANLKTFRFSEQDIITMKAIVEQEKLTRSELFHLCFALGKALEDLGEHDDAFAYYQRGNQIKRKVEGYDASEISRAVDRHIQLFQPGSPLTNTHRGIDSSDPIFITGLPRSGSTLLEQILASHSMVDGTKELPDIMSMAKRLGGKKRKHEHSEYPEVLLSLTREQTSALGQEYLDRTRNQRGSAPYFIDKMPNNFLHIGFIKTILPNAKIIDARRHPMSACFSGFKQLFAAGQSFSYSLDDIGRYYLDYHRLMNHWQQIYGDQIITVIYEQVVSDLDSEVRRILEYCGLPFEQNCLEFYNTDRAVRTASSEQVRQPIYRSGLDAWKPYRNHLQDLEKLIKPVIKGYPVRL